MSKPVSGVGKATHINYLHPKHIREVLGGKAYCVSPGAQCYSALLKQNPKDWNKESEETQRELMKQRA